MYKIILHKINDNKKIILYFIILIIILIFIIFFVKKNVVQKGIFKNKIIFGQVCSLTGLYKNLGLDYSLGYTLAFQFINRIDFLSNNIKLELLIYDDKYKPELSLENVKLLVQYYDVFSIIGPVGTPTTNEINDYLIEKNIPLLQPLTGANFLRSSFNKNMIYSRPSYKAELEVIIKYLKKIKKYNIAVIYIESAYGLSTYYDVIEIISNEPLFNLIVSGKYKLDDKFIDNALSSLLGININSVYNKNLIKNSKNLNEIESIIFLGDVSKLIDLINYFKDLKKNINIFTITGTEYQILEKKLFDIDPKYTENIYITQILPNIKEQNPKLFNIIIKELNIFKTHTSKDEIYYKIMIDNINSLSNILVEGFINGLFIADVLKKSLKIKSGDPRENLINTIFKKKNFNIFGFKFGPFLDFADCKDNFKNCPCNVGLRDLYLYKYNTNSKFFENIGNYKTNC
jgi:hypothetical protein